MSTPDRPERDSWAPDLSRLVAGGSFIHDAPTEVPAVWGSGDEVLWSEGEPLIITGPTGVGKTTLGGQVVAGRLGLADAVLGYRVAPGRRVLYLAMDRPAQISRALARHLRRYPRELLDERLTVWRGPPPRDLARHPALLLQLAQHAGADTVVLDSLKDAAVKLSDEEVGQGLSRAMQLCVATGVEVLGYHHQTKRGGGGTGKPNSLVDVYGSTWITAGAGSVLLLWGDAGDPVVELSHLKQPAGEVGPLRLVHDHMAGTTTVFHGTDVLSLLKAGPRTPREIATVVYGENPSAAEVEKARRKLEKLAREGHAIRLDDATRGGATNGAKGGSTGTRYGAAAIRQTGVGSTHDRSTLEDVSAGQSTHGTNRASEVHGSVHAPHDSDVSAGQSTHVSTHAPHAPSTHVSPSPYKGGERGDAWLKPDESATDSNGHVSASDAAQGRR